MNKEIEHKKMDEIVENFRVVCHEELDKAMTCGAVNPDEHDDRSYMLVKCVLSLCGEGGHFSPLSWDKPLKKFKNNLSHFVG